MGFSRVRGERFRAWGSQKERTMPILVRLQQVSKMMQPGFCLKKMVMFSEGPGMMAAPSLDDFAKRN
jgi:hypothetical protein